LLKKAGSNNFLPFFPVCCFDAKSDLFELL